ncbi:MAG TPA: DUF6712 family protein, partial [Hymenobacter sp.]
QGRAAAPARSPHPQNLDRPMSFIRTIEQYRAHVVVNTSTDLENLQPDLRLAESQRLRPLLGPALYNELQALSDAEVTQLLADGEDVRGGLLHLIHGALANLAALEYLVVNQVQISDAGVHIFSDQGKKTAFQWQINDLKASFRRKGHNALEEVLAYLDEHAAAPELEAWATSAAAVAAHQHLLASARQFSYHYAINDSRLTYLALLPTLRKVERFELAPVIGPALFAEIRAQLITRTVSPANALLLDEYLRPALAHLTMAKALNGDVGLALNGDAVELNMYRLDDANQKEADANFSQVLTMKAEQARADGRVYLTQLRQFLNQTASATTYATYFNSSAYASPNAARPVVDNSADKPTYRFF